MTNTPKETLLTAKEAAEMCGITTGTLRNYALKGRIRHVKKLSRYYFFASDLDQLTQVFDPMVPHSHDKLS